MTAGKRQVATLLLRAGRARMRLKVSMTPAGLVATGALVSSILLSTAALVGVATRAGRHDRHARRAAIREDDDPSALVTLREDT